jgi:hypothetical protein
MVFQRFQSLSPAGLLIDDVAIGPDHVIITARCRAAAGECPDCEQQPGTVEAWLSCHPEITVISRDRGGSYGRAATRAAPQAVQVADRWHLMENASAAFLEAVRRSMRPIRQALGSALIDPALLTYAERLQHDGYLRRQEAYGAIRALVQIGAPIREIVRRTGRSRKLVREIVAVAEAICSVAGQVRLSRISLGSMPNGRPAAATAPSCGGGFGPPASAGVCELSRSGRRGDDVPRMPGAKPCARCRPPGCSAA